ELAVDEGNVTVSPQTLAAGDEVTIQATIVNAGAITASGVVVALTSDIGEVARTTLDDLAPGSLGVATLKWTPAPGSHLVRVIVDPDGEIAETDEGNNQISITLMVISPDLSVVPSDISIDPSYPTESSETTLWIVITNNKQLVAGPFKVRITVDGEDLGTREVAIGLVGGDNVTLELPWTATPGRHTFKVEVDPDGDVIEEDLSNNVASRTFSVNARPRAILKVSDEEVKTGDEVTLDASDSFDTDGRIRQYFFDYGDGTDSGWTFFATGKHIYAVSGEYEVRLYVRDEAEAQNQEPTVVTIRITRRDSGEESSPGPVALMALMALAIVAFALIHHRRDGENR
ncbi:MAG: PKD domain-containing protein, partial [Thermoplasmata archaeon]|nr:PKD domain-containing protein [Thermoplasmata archaeon]